MAHEIHIEGSRASMMYVGDAPWHKLGTKLHHPATSQEAIVAANLDWDVIKKPLIAFDGQHCHPVPDRFAIVRKDWWGKPKPIYGIVGPQYTPLQNRDAFAFFDDIVGMGAAVYHTAGALGDGERVWILAKLPDDIVVAADDNVGKYLLLSNSHDGSSAVQIKFTPIRVVCNNTLTMALRKGEILRVPHIKNMAERMRRVRDLLGIIHRRYASIETAFAAMAKRELQNAELEHYLLAVFPDPPRRDNNKAIASAETGRAWSTHFFRHGQGNSNTAAAGTVWAAYNGVTEFIDHCLPARGAGTADKPSPAAMARRLDFAWFGDGFSIKARAYKAAQDLVNAAATN